MPLALYASCNGAVQMMGALGTFETSLTVYAYPKVQGKDALTPEDITNLEDCKTWWIPMANTVAFTSVGFLLFFIFLTDTPKYFLSVGKTMNAKQVIDKIYKNENNQRLTERILVFIDTTGDKEVSKIGFMDAFFRDERYTRASWVSLMVNFFHIFTGNNAVLVILPTLTKDLMGDNYQIGLVGAHFFIFLTTATSIYTNKIFGRRTLIFWGHLSIAIEMSLVGVFILIGQDAIAFIFVVLVLGTYNLTTSQASWIYAAEVCCDVALGMNIALLYISDWLAAFLET
jgi:hypothetical protein